MLRKILDYQLSLTEKGKPLHFLKPLINASDTFLYEPLINTSKGPHIRDAVDIKRWMVLVVIALIPCTLMAIWNTGLMKFVYGSGDYKLMNEYLSASRSIGDYFAFAGKNDRWMTILQYGLGAFLPVALVSYAVGGFWEALFAVVRKHEISEGFLVTGILYALILPPTIPYWMVAVGVSVGVILGKEVFGGSGMNIVNPALACRCFLFFAYPAKMSGNVWVGTNPTEIQKSLIKMNKDAGTSSVDAYTQATPLARFNIGPDIKRIHIDAIATNDLGDKVSTFESVKQYFSKWVAHSDVKATLGKLTPEQMKQFVTSSLSEGGLGLSSGSYEDAYSLASLNYGIGDDSPWRYFLGNRLGSMGETSGFFCLLGALFLIYVGVGSWRTMVAMALGAFLTASMFQLGSTYLAADGGAWTSAQWGFPAYKHLILGGLAFGLVFMATDPVSSPSNLLAKWIYGLFCGMVTIVIRVLNPAYPEGVMLAILMGNVFAPLMDYYCNKYSRKRSLRNVSTAS